VRRGLDGGEVTTTTRDTNRYGYPTRQPAEVIAVLVDDGSAGPVAAVAVREAVALQAPVRFLQVVPGGLDSEARAVTEEALFRAGLHALRGHPRTRSVFETLPPHPSRTIRARSRNAALLVVGEVQPHSVNQFVANLRRSASHCPMRVVAASVHAAAAIDTGLRDSTVPTDHKVGTFGPAGGHATGTR
jgi:hypothetical protein